MASREDRDFLSFEKIGNEWFRKVLVGNQPILVSIDEGGGGGDPLVYFSEVNSVSGNSSVELLSYTVPIGKVLTLRLISLGGLNKAVYVVKKDTDLIFKLFNYYTNLQSSHQVDNLIFNAGEKVVIDVTNSSNTTSDFASTIQGRLNDA